MAAHGTGRPRPSVSIRTWTCFDADACSSCPGLMRDDSPFLWSGLAAHASPFRTQKRLRSRRQPPVYFRTSPGASAMWVIRRLDTCPIFVTVRRLTSTPVSDTVAIATLQARRSGRVSRLPVSVRSAPGAPLRRIFRPATRMSPLPSSNLRNPRERVQRPKERETRSLRALTLRWEECRQCTDGSGLPVRPRRG
jgi:hypothetical protein